MTIEDKDRENIGDRPRDNYCSEASKIKLTCCKDSENPSDISVIEIVGGCPGNAIAGRECIINHKDVNAFRADCEDWDSVNYEQDFSIVAFIAADTWNKWCASYSIDSDSLL